MKTFTLASAMVAFLAPCQPAIGMAGPISTATVLLAARQANIQITSITPTTVTIGQQVTITVRGSGFPRDSRISIQGVDFDTTYVSPTELRGSLRIPSTYVGGVALYVYSASGVSNNATLTVNYPVPSMQSVDPNRLTADGRSHQVRVNLFGLTDATTFTVNGTRLESSQVSSVDGRNVNIRLPASYFQRAGELRIAATNPTPGGGTSANSVTITVTNPR